MMLQKIKLYKQDSNDCVLESMQNAYLYAVQERHGVLLPRDKNFISNTREMYGLSDNAVITQWTVDRIAKEGVLINNKNVTFAQFIVDKKIIQSKIKAGRPVLCLLNFKYSNNEGWLRLSDNDRQIVSKHAVCICGYDEKYLYCADSMTASIKKISYDFCKKANMVSEGMVAIYSPVFK